MKNNQFFLVKKIAVVGIVLFFPAYAYAADCTVTTNTTISADCTNLSVTSNVNSITIDSGKTVTGNIASGGAVQIPDGANRSIGTITNNGTINGSATGGSGVYVSSNSDTGFITSLVNNGTISGANYGLNLNAYELVAGQPTVGNITNNVGAVITQTGNFGAAVELRSAGTIDQINNAGTISGAGHRSLGITIGTQVTVNTLTNSGSIYGNNTALVVFGRIETLTNTAILGTSSTGIFGESGIDISNYGVITTMNNAQSNLVIQGNLPTNYNIIINSTTSYGSLSAYSNTLNAGTKTNFGIAPGSTFIRGSYSQVLNGLSAANLGTKTGSYQGLTWALTSTNNVVWDLNFTGTNTAVTAANALTAQGLQTAFALQNTVLVNGFTYDCPLFDKNNVCVSAGGRYTAVDAQSVNSGAGVLIGAYRWNNQVRFGAYIDQNVSTNTTGIIKVSNGSPMVGLFGVWSERLDGVGPEVRVSVGYGQKNTTMTRPVIDGTEPGSGSSTLTSQGAQAIAKYGFAVTDSTVIAPYAGLRYTQNNMNGYTENASASVTAPLTYAPLNTNATTVVAGLGANYKIIPAVTLMASAGVEADTNTQYSSYTATGLYGLTPISMNPNPKYTRPTGMLGAYYDVEKNQRITLSGVYRQAPYQGVGATTYMALYTIGL